MMMIEDAMWQMLCIRQVPARHTDKLLMMSTFARIVSHCATARAVLFLAQSVGKYWSVASGHSVNSELSKHRCAVSDVKLRRLLLYYSVSGLLGLLFWHQLWRSAA